MYCTTEEALYMAQEKASSPAEIPYHGFSAKCARLKSFVRVPFE